MIGLPGDFTPPSRSVQAAVFSQTARPTATGEETICEIFRILDNFNVALGAAEGNGDDRTQGMRGGTIRTSASDTPNEVYFGWFNAIIRMPLDRMKAPDIEDVTPRM